MLSSDPKGLSVFVQINSTAHLIPFHSSLVSVHQLSAFNFQQTAKTNVLTLDCSVQRPFSKLASIGPAQFLACLFKKASILALAMNKFNRDVPPTCNFYRLIRDQNNGEDQAKQ